jgi:hypothetical protein
MQQNGKIPLDYAPAPRPMSRRRLAGICGTAAGVSIAIGGVVYAITPTTMPVLSGKMASPGIRAATQPASIALPGSRLAPPTRWQEPVSAPVPATRPTSMVLPGDRSAPSTEWQEQPVAPSHPEGEP